LTLNDIVGNAVGLSVQESTAGVKATKNNIYGNGTDGSNCGITVFHNGADARNNYWGASTGPGPDPADQVGEEPLCDGTIPNNDAGIPLTIPFSKDPLVIN
jgi:nitrous oxidase accessory protein NosD